MTAKVFSQAGATGQPPNLTVQRQSDGLFLQSDGTFGASLAYIVMPEIFDGFFQYSDSAEVWNTGYYNVRISVGSTVDSLSGFVQYVSGDTQIGFLEASSVTSKNATSSLLTQLSKQQDSIDAQATTITILGEKIDSFQSILNRGSYHSTTTQ